MGVWHLWAKKGLLKILNEGDLGLTESQWRAKVVGSGVPTQKKKDTSAKSQNPISTHQVNSVLVPEFSARSWVSPEVCFQGSFLSSSHFFHPKDKVLGGV
jgi:hypothetical protein